MQLYREKFGSLPVSDRGKPLQEVMQDMPSINLVGGKPWTIHVTLVGGVAKDPGTGVWRIILVCVCVCVCVCISVVRDSQYTCNYILQVQQISLPGLLQSSGNF